MTKYDSFARALQARGRESELDKFDDYDDAQIRRAIQYTREDVILLVAHLSGVNAQLQTIRRLMWVVVLLIAFAILR